MRSARATIFFALVEIQHKRLLAQDVAAGVQRVAHDGRSHVRMRRDIDDVEVRLGQHLAVIEINRRFREEFVAAANRVRLDDVHQRDNIPARDPIGVQVLLRDAPPQPMSPMRGRYFFGIGGR